jgi:hypothetical protein
MAHEEPIGIKSIGKIYETKKLKTKAFVWLTFPLLKFPIVIEQYTLAIMCSSLYFNHSTQVDNVRGLSFNKRYSFT